MVMLLLETIGTAYTLIDLHSVSAYGLVVQWSQCLLCFSFWAAVVITKHLTRIHKHVKAKLQDEFVHLGSEFHMECRPTPDTSNPNVGTQEGKQVGYQAARSVLDVQAEVEKQALLEKRARHDRAKRGDGGAGG